MKISVDELAHDPDKCLAMLQDGDVYIEKGGEYVAKLTKIKPLKAGIASKLFGILPKEADLEESREERLNAI